MKLKYNIVVLSLGGAMKIVRFGVSIPEDLLTKFDEMIEEKGYANRSED